MEPGTDWVSASELGDYAFCPRSHWYARHPPAAPPTSASLAREAHGERYHSRALRSRAQRSERWGSYLAILALAILLGLFALALLLGWL